MNKNIITGILLCACLLLANMVSAEEYATKRDAEAIVKKAVAHIKNIGLEKAAEDFNNRKGDFVKLDLYIIVHDMQGMVIAHGQNKKSVGKDSMNLKDPDGKEFIKERVDLARSKGKFWQEYKYTDPVTKKVLPKEAYCEPVSEVVVCAGVYKR